MVDYSVTNYNPYNMYHNYGYYYPSFNGAYTQQYQNIPLYDFNALNYNYKPDTITFSANNQVQAETKKQGMSNGAKVAIGAGIVTALAVGADFLFCKGKHVKSIFGKAGNKGNKPHNTKPPVNNNKEAIEQATKQNLNTDMIYPLKSSNAIKIDEFESLNNAVENYKNKLKSGKYGAPENIENMLNSLTGHSYGNDKSFIQITTRSLKQDYTRYTLDVEKNEFYKVPILVNPRSMSMKKDVLDFQLPDSVGEYLITTLPTGQKVVSISLPTGRFDPRPIRLKMSIISKDNEFTPLQKDLIEIISNRKNTLSRYDNTADIMSIGVLANDSVRPSFRTPDATPFEFNKEVLLSSISKAKQQLNEESIDRHFIEKALNVKGNEKVAYFEFPR